MARVSGFGLDGVWYDAESVADFLAAERAVPKPPVTPIVKPPREMPQQIAVLDGSAPAKARKRLTVPVMPRKVRT